MCELSVLIRFSAFFQINGFLKYHFILMISAVFCFFFINQPRPLHTFYKNHWLLHSSSYSLSYSTQVLMCQSLLFCIVLAEYWQTNYPPTNIFRKVVSNPLLRLKREHSRTHRSWILGQTGSTGDVEIHWRS
jgi:hypothetical protein